ncbi:hypothetical protein Y032_0059g2991 [Ancylostoma ceylanicum]|uniref:Receptor L-domain domain-containing protein n=1 Tax=Ancylostoma ceylanicum TaxID=53326 RepID=A0A016U4Y8_9BILA|nr:hypothetical protein Y032_0059g2991 [Ancylostoma ceylanicum]
MRVIPKNVENLRGIQTIEGRLIIANNSGLKEFNYFSSLKEVGILDDHEVAIIVKNNPVLKRLPMPNLVDIELKKENKRVKLINNPVLDTSIPKTTTLEQQATTAVQQVQTATKRAKTVTQKTRDVVHQTKVMEKKKTVMVFPKGDITITTEKSSLERDKELAEEEKHDAALVERVKASTNKKWIWILTLAFLVLLVLTFAGVCVVFRIKRVSSGLPPPPYSLNKRSREQLTSVCQLAVVIVK